MRGTEKQRQFYGIITVDENLFIIGGMENGKCTTKTEVFNSITQRWELGSPLNKARKYVVFIYKLFTFVNRNTTNNSFFQFFDSVAWA